MQSVTCCCFSGKWAYAKASLTATITLLAIGLIGYYAKTDSAAFQQGFLGAFGTAAGISFLIFIRELVTNDFRTLPEGEQIEEENYAQFKRDFVRYRNEMGVKGDLLVKAKQRQVSVREHHTERSDESMQASSDVSHQSGTLEYTKDIIRRGMRYTNFAEVMFSELTMEGRAEAISVLERELAHTGTYLIAEIPHLKTEVSV